jgi:hypothetical protein
MPFGTPGGRPDCSWSHQKWGSRGHGVGTHRSTTVTSVDAERLTQTLAQIGSAPAGCTTERRNTPVKPKTRIDTPAPFSGSENSPNTVATAHRDEPYLWLATPRHPDPHLPPTSLLHDSLTPVLITSEDIGRVAVQRTGEAVVAQRASTTPDVARGTPSPCRPHGAVIRHPTWPWWC